MIQKTRTGGAPTASFHITSHRHVHWHAIPIGPLTWHSPISVVFFFCLGKNKCYSWDIKFAPEALFYTLTRSPKWDESNLPALGLEDSDEFFDGLGHGTNRSLTGQPGRGVGMLRDFISWLVAAMQASARSHSCWGSLSAISISVLLSNSSSSSVNIYVGTGIVVIIFPFIRYSSAYPSIIYPFRPDVNVFLYLGYGSLTM